MKTIEQARQDRRELEDLFLEKVKEYEKRYGVIISSIKIDSMVSYTTFEETKDIKIQVKL